MQLNTIHCKILKPEFRKCIELATPTQFHTVLRTVDIS